MTALIGAGEPGRASLPADGLSVLLISAFDLGHQPFGQRLRRRGSLPTGRRWRAWISRCRSWMTTQYARLT
jgi:hypothetical protein